MKNRVFKITIFIIQISFFLMVLKFNFKCLLKEYLNIECPGCGLTRAFKSMLQLNFIDAFNYNILSIPLFFILLVFNILIIYDIIFNKKISNKLYKLLIKHYYIIIILLILSMLINNIK